MKINSLLRDAEHAAISRITLSGKGVDLGGDSRSGYQDLFKGKYELVTVNLNEKSNPDVLHNLEKPLPFKDKTFDFALMINVLEHIFDYRQLLEESARIVKKEGAIVIVVPFLFPYHPSPEDYRRFTVSALRRELEIVGVRDIDIRPLGSGVFSAYYLFVDRLMPSIVRLIFYWTMRFVALGADKLFTFCGKIFGS